MSSCALASFPLMLALAAALIAGTVARAQSNLAPVHSDPSEARGGAPPAAVDASRPVAIQVDLGQRLGAYIPLYAWFGYDEANYTTAPNGVKLLRELHDLSPVPVTIRAHHLLTSGDGTPDLKWSSTNVYVEDATGKPVYDFRILDGIFDAYRDAGVRPMVELGFMPKDLAIDLPDHRPYQVPYPQSTVSGASNNPPKDYAKWRELARVVTAHLVERYGRAAVSRWYFEVWNEPNIPYWHGTPEEYFKLYDYAVAGVRAALPGARVGGPATTGPTSATANAFLDDFLRHVRFGKSAADGRAIPLDFISFHAKGKPQIDGGRVTMGISKELADTDQGFETIAKYPRLRSLPIILSEADPEGCAACSSKVNPANNYRNGTLYPAYTAAAYKGLFELQDRRGVNLLAMLSWSFEFEQREYFEGFRSLATNGIDKPVLNFFRMAALMGGERVGTRSDGRVPLEEMLARGVRTHADVDAMATVADGHASIMLWNYHDVDEPAPPTPTSVTVAHLPARAHRVLITHYRIDDDHSNAYTVWKAMGSPQQPTAAQVAELQSRAGLELLASPAWADAADGQVTIETSMPRQSVSLLRLDW
jgi:xylan 1,4-beta-xylosidase